MFNWLRNFLGMNTELYGDHTWPFYAYIDGDDIVVDDIAITCFGGGFDPQDDGSTASGINTKRVPNIAAVSLPMDIGERSPHTMGSPIPRIPWHTPVAVTVGGKTLTLGAGVIDIGPGKQASKPGEPHALDLTPGAAALFAPGVPFSKLAEDFEVRGSYRIIGGAKYYTPVEIEHSGMGGDSQC